MVLKNATKRAKEYLEEIEDLTVQLNQDCREGDYRAAYETGFKLLYVVYKRFQHQLNEESK